MAGAVKSLKQSDNQAIRQSNNPIHNEKDIIDFACLFPWRRCHGTEFGHNPLFQYRLYAQRGHLSACTARHVQPALHRRLPAVALGQIHAWHRPRAAGQLGIPVQRRPHVRHLQRSIGFCGEPRGNARHLPPHFPRAEDGGPGCGPCQGQIYAQTSLCKDERACGRRL